MTMINHDFIYTNRIQYMMIHSLTALVYESSYIN